jgi:hypothetical protein
MQIEATVLAVVVVLVVSCGSKNLQPGICKSDVDCPGSTCDTTDGGSFRCLSRDGGMGGTDGNQDGDGDGDGDDGSAFRCDAYTQCLDAVAPACALESASCVECVIDGDCRDATKPICGTDHVCRGCLQGTNNECALHTEGTVCFAGSCVQCATSADCSPYQKSPICGSDLICRGCQADSECTGIGATDPGICMAETDGHCATEGEGIYVQNIAGCADTDDTISAGRFSSSPFCSMQLGLAKLGPTGCDLLVVTGTVSGATSTYPGQGGNPLLIVGQQSAFIQGGASPAFNMQAGIVNIRGVEFSSSGATGIQATGGTLRLNMVLVDNCATGGILLDGTQFEIENSTVENNGPSADLSWGGIRIQNRPTGPSVMPNLSLVTIVNNGATGLSCTGPIVGTGVLATGNATENIVSACGVTACSTAGSDCGAPP